MSRIVRNAISLGSALLLAASLGATALAADPTNVQTATNTATAAQTAAAVSGPAVATDNATAVSGNAAVTLVGDQYQSNVQLVGAAGVDVIGIGPGTTATVPITTSQTATNGAALEQTGTAASGTAGAAVTTGGDATSGDATVALFGAQAQSNVQLVGAASVGVVTANSATTADVASDQVATNAAIIGQAGAAVSGAAAANAGATAKSGDATVYVNGEQAQLNTQVVADIALAALSGDSTTAAPIAIVQIADNGATLGQSASALSGRADAAEAGATAWSGNVRATDAAVQVQENEQAALNLAATLAGLRTGAIATTAAVQTASNQASIVQAIAGVSGDVAAAGPASWAWSGDADAVASAYQAQEIEQAIANVAFAFGPDALVTATLTSVQDGLNTATIDQAAAAASGTAAAVGPEAWAFSGNAAASVAADQTQLLKQVVVNLGFGDAEVIAVVDNAQTADQAASVVPQAAAAISGPAETIGNGTTITGDVLTDETMSQLQEGFQGAIYINGVLLVP